jgi:hypothetical protein
MRVQRTSKRPGYGEKIQKNSGGDAGKTYERVLAMSDNDVTDGYDVPAASDRAISAYFASSTKRLACVLSGRDEKALA